MRRVQTSANYKRPKGEVNNLPSLTIPDESLTVRQLLDNHTRGHHFKNTRVPVYDPDNDLPDLRTLDLTEIDDLRETLAQDVASKQANVQKAKQNYVKTLFKPKVQTSKIEGGTTETSTNQPDGKG